MITLYYNIHNNTILIPGVGTFANRSLLAEVVGNKVVIRNAGQVIYSGSHSNLQNGGDIAGISGTPGTPVSFGADNTAVAAGVNAFVNHSEADWLSFLGLV